MRELVTVQCGEEANWVGAYYWALQAAEGGADGEAGGPSPLYESTTAGASYEPRALLVDVPEAFNPFRPTMTAEEAGKKGQRAAALTWRGGVDVHVQQQQQQPQQQQQSAMAVDGDGPLGPVGPQAWAEAWQGMRSWPQLDRHCVAHMGPDSAWGDAHGGEHLRRLLEGCDAPQGAHVVVDLVGPWLGYGVGAVEEWAEEVGGGGLACLALHRAGGGGLGWKTASDRDWALVEAALGVHRLLEAGALLLPLEASAATGGHGVKDEQAQRRRATQAVGLAAASGVYARGGGGDGGCHMREWVHGVRSGAGSGLATLELAFPFPPPAPHTEAQAQTQTQAGSTVPSSLRELLQPADPRSVLQAGTPPSGLLSHLTPLTPGGQARRPSPIRRVTGVAALYLGPGDGFGLGPGRLLGALNDACKFYPWFQPALNHAEASRAFPVRRWPFPTAWRVSAAEQAEDAGRAAAAAAGGGGGGGGNGHAASASAAPTPRSGGWGALSLVGCTSATLPFSRELAGALAGGSGGRGPGARVRARLREEKGLLEEDVGEVAEALEGLCAAFDDQAEAEAQAEAEG